MRFRNWLSSELQDAKKSLSEARKEGDPMKIEIARERLAVLDTVQNNLNRTEPRKYEV